MIRFEADVTGDGSAEVFYTKGSLRDGKQGYLWSIFSKSANDTLRLIGDVTFSVEVFKLSAWKGDDKSKGFYTYFPSGGSRGSLAFFEVTASEITRLESRKIEPNGADKPEFDSLFAARLTGKVPKLELKRTILSKQQRTTIPKSVLATQSEMQEAVPTPISPSLVRPPPKPSAETKLSPTRSENPASSRPWSVIVILIAATIALTWLLLKKRK